MIENKIEKIAVLIDGDNAQAKLLKAILEEIAKYGKVTIRRIYGDWTQSNMNSWKDLLNDLSFYTDSEIQLYFWQKLDRWGINY